MPPLSETLIRFEDAAMGYGRTVVLSGVSCALAAGSFTGLVGPNGSGKTTFLKTLLRFLPPLSGRVSLKEGLRCAYVPQMDTMNLLWPLTVREAVALGVRARRPFGRATPEERDAVGSAIERTGLAGLAGRLLSAVSGGQRQRAVLAQALAQRPEVLVLDEPTRGLDVVAERDFLELLAGLQRREGLTVLFVTHALPAVLNHAEGLLLFRDGRVIPASPDELAAPGRLEAIYGIPFVHGEAGGLRWVAPARKEAA